MHGDMKNFKLETSLDMDKHEGQNSFNLAWVKEFILEQNLISFITPQKERIAQPLVWFFLIQGNIKLLLETSLDMDKYEGWSSFNLACVKEFISEQNLILFITSQKERIAQPQLWFFVILGNMKKFMLETTDKYEGQSSFNLAWVKEFILEENSKSLITPQKERIAQP